MGWFFPALALVTIVIAAACGSWMMARFLRDVPDRREIDGLRDEVDALRAEVEQSRQELAEAQERLDFTERLLTKGSSRPPEAPTPT